MAHAEFVVHEQSGTWDVADVSIHRTEEKAIGECDRLHAKDGCFYEVEYLWVEGGQFGDGGSKGREIIDSELIYSVGSMSGKGD